MSNPSATIRGAGVGERSGAIGGARSATHELSSGAVVELPLSTSARMYGAVYGADRAGVEALLPEQLHPIAVAPGRAAVAFTSVDYQRIGCPDIDPYGEFLVILPATFGAEPGVPLLSLLRRGGLGYVWYMPVTTREAVELGREIWGFPKVVADISFRDEGERRRTDVRVDGSDFIRLESKRTATLDLDLELAGGTVREGTLLEERLELDGRLGCSPLGTGVSLTLGDHPRAERLREMDLGARPLFRFYADTELVIHPGRPLREE